MGVLDRSFELYVENWYASLVFGLLLMFAAWFQFFPNAFLAAGTFFWDIGVPALPAPNILAAILSTLVYILFFSVFLSVIIFQIRRRLVHVNLKVYLREIFQRFVLRLFLFWAVLSVVLFALHSALVLGGVSAPVAILLISILALSLFFVPQAVVVDEEGLIHALLNNFEFLIRKPVSFASAIVLGLVLVAVLQVVDAGLANSVEGGHLAGLVLGVLFVLPFLEIVKTYLYMGKFGVLAGHEKRVLGR